MEGKFEQVEKWLIYYYRNEFKMAIENRKDYVTNPPSMVEELGVKVTTGFSTESPQERQIASDKTEIPDIVNDYILNKLERLERTIKLFLEGCNQWEQELLYLKYKESKSWEYIVSELPFERTKLFNMRNDLIHRLARHLAWLK